MPFRGVRASEYSRYSERTSAIELRLLKLIKGFTEDDMDLIIIYHDEPDLTGHEFGPDIDDPLSNLSMVLHECDKIIGIRGSMLLLNFHLLEYCEKVHLYMSI